VDNIPKLPQQIALISARNELDAGVRRLVAPSIDQNKTAVWSQHVVRVPKAHTDLNDFVLFVACNRKVAGIRVNLNIVAQKVHPDLFVRTRLDLVILQCVAKIYVDIVRNWLGICFKRERRRRKQIQLVKQTNVGRKISFIRREQFIGGTSC